MNIHNYGNYRNRDWLKHQIEYLAKTYGLVAKECGVNLGTIRTYVHQFGLEYKGIVEIPDSRKPLYNPDSQNIEILESKLVYYKKRENFKERNITRFKDGVSDFTCELLITNNYLHSFMPEKYPYLYSVYEIDHVKYEKTQKGEKEIWFDKAMALQGKKVDDGEWVCFVPCPRCGQLVDFKFISEHGHICYLCKQKSLVNEFRKVLDVLKKCPECGNWISSDLVFCLVCGWLDIEVLGDYNREFQELLKISIKNDKQGVLMKEYRRLYKEEHNKPICYDIKYGGAYLDQRRAGSSQKINELEKELNRLKNFEDNENHKLVKKERNLDEDFERQESKLFLHELADEFKETFRLCLECGNRRGFGTIICEKCGCDELEFHKAHKQFYYDKKIKPIAEKMAKFYNIPMEEARKSALYGIRSGLFKFDRIRKLVEDD